MLSLEALFSGWKRASVQRKSFRIGVWHAVSVDIIRIYPIVSPTLYCKYMLSLGALFSGWKLTLQRKGFIFGVACSVSWYHPYLPDYKSDIVNIPDDFLFRGFIFWLKTYICTTKKFHILCVACWYQSVSWYHPYLPDNKSGDLFYFTSFQCCA